MESERPFKRSGPKGDPKIPNSPSGVDSRYSTQENFTPRAGQQVASRKLLQTTVN